MSLTPPAATVRLGTLVQLAPTVTVDGRVAERSITLVSSDPSVVFIGDDGSLRAVRIGTASVTATSGGTSATALVTVIAGAPASIVKAAGDSQSTAAGSPVPIPPAVTLRDSVGNPVPGIIVTFSGTGTVVGASATTNASGTAAVTSWTLAPDGGANSLTATAAGVGYVTFAASGTAPTIALGSTELSVSRPVGSRAAITQAIEVANAGSGTLWGLSLGSISYIGAPDWLTASMDATVAPTTIRLAANPTGLPVGTYSATVPVLGTNAMNRVQSLVLTLTIDQATTTTTIVSSNNPSALGQPVTVTATVTAPGTTPAGSVQFKDGGVPVGAPVTLSSEGVASLTTSSLSIAASPHLITAEYAGDAASKPSVSGALGQVIGVAPTSTRLAASQSSVTYGSPVTLTATVAGSGGTPTGVVQFRDGTTPLGATSLTDGVSSFSTVLGRGAHSVTAVYGGDANNGGSTSAALAEQIESAATVTTLSSNLNPSTFGQAVTLTASVAGPAGIPGGMVSFNDGATTLATVALSGSGSASTTLTSLDASGSPHAITAAYAGDATYAPSTSAPVAQSVARSSTSTTVSSSTPSASAGDVITLSAVVSSSVGAAPSGVVTFSDAGTVVGTAALTGGNASLSTSALSAAGSPHPITATYAGDANHSASISSTLNQVVTQGTPTVSLLTSANPSSSGGTVTFTATVSGSLGVATGSVTFKDGTLTLGTVSLVGGVAAFTTTSLGARSAPHSITASYAGDATYLASTSAALSQVVNGGTTSTVLSSSSNPAGVGAPVTFTATVTGNATTPTGSVTFKDGGVILGSATVAGGTAVLTTSSLAASGAHDITAVYGGDESNLASTSPSLSQSVAAVATTTSLSSSANPATFAQAVTFTATVSSGAGSITGLVQFKDGGVNLGAPQAVNGSGQASLTTSTLSSTSSPHAISASYSGDAAHLASSSSSLAQVIERAPTTTTISASSATSVVGANVTFTAVIGSAAGVPGGAVVFKDGSAVLGSADAGPDGVATMTVAIAGTGTHAITASYASNASYLASTSAALTHVVRKATPTNTVSATAVSQITTLVARVEGSGGSSAPTGTVTFKDGTTALGGPVALVDGVATYSLLLPSYAGARHAIVATYNGDANYDALASASFDYTVAASTVTLERSTGTNPSKSGSVLTFTATVNVAAGLAMPTGTVQFRDNEVDLGPPVALVGGRATYSTTTLSLMHRVHAISVFYSGDLNFQQNVSRSLSQTITP